MTRSARPGPLQVLLQSIDSALDGITKSNAISDEDAHSARKLLRRRARRFGCCARRSVTSSIGAKTPRFATRRARYRGCVM